MKTLHAIVWASGLLEFKEEIPSGAVSMCRGPSRQLKKLVEPSCRLGKGASKGLLLVPGIPEAEDQEAAMDALIAHAEWLKRHAPECIRFSRFKSKAEATPCQ